MNKKRYLILVAFFTGLLNIKCQVYPASNFTLISVINPETGANSNGDKYSGCWGWYQPNKNKEYAIACSRSGTYWVDVTNAATPSVSAYRTGSVTNATWREVKTYLNYCYVISDDNGSNSFQIFDMQYLPDSVSKIYDSQNLFSRGHTLWVDGNKLYVAAVTYSNNNFSSMNVYSLANPAAPALLRQLDQDYSFINYVHDMYARNDTVFASCGYQGLYVFKLNANNTFTELGSLTAYPYSGYNHSSGLTPDGQTLVFTDEIPTGRPIKIANVSNLNNIQVLALTNQFPQTTPHNPFIVSNQYCFMSSYLEGLQLYDISNPSAPQLAGYFDTFPQAGGNNGNWSGDPYDGQWGAYPYFPSKHIFALDQKNGLFMLKTIAANFTLPISICAGQDIKPMMHSYNAATYSWTLSGATPSVSALANPTVSYAAAGTYSINLLATNGPDSISVTKILTVMPNPLAGTTSTNTACGTCSTGVVSVTVSTGMGPFSYTWSPSGGYQNVAGGLSAGCYTVLVRDAYTCSVSAQACVSADINTGLQQNAENTVLKIYPNPAQNLLYIEYPGNNFNYTLYNCLGEPVVLNKNVHGKTMLNLGGLSPGIYFLETECGANKLSSKIIIEP